MAILVYGSGGGSGNDISYTTAIQGDVLPGKYFYLADGTKVEGSMATKAAATNRELNCFFILDTSFYIIWLLTIYQSLRCKKSYGMFPANLPETCRM